MRILFLCHYFPPEVNAPASRTYEHCVRWVRAGHQVTVITCVPNCPDGVVFAGFRSRFRRQIETVDGIKVVRVWTYIAPNKGMLRRIANYLTYMVSGVWAALREPQADVTVSTSPQFFCGWAGVWTARLKRTKFVLEIRDIWPESIAAVGAMKKGLATRYLEWLEKRMYRAADQIITVGNGYKAQIAAKAPSHADRITVVMNGVDPELFKPLPRDEAFLSKWGLAGKFVVSYVGTIGMAHALEVVLHASQQLRSQGRDDIAFMLVGDGARREELERQTIELNLSDRVIFTGRLPRDEMPKVLASSDACLVHLRGTELFGTVVPSKIFETMAMGRPIIMGVRGESRDIVLAAGAAVIMEPESVEDLVRVVLQLADDPERSKTLGANAREYVLTHFPRDKQAGMCLEVLQQLVGTSVDTLRSRE